MLLVIDVGNTNTKIGVCDADRVLVSWTLTTRREQTADEYGVFTEALLRTRGITPADVEGVAISNVVPPVQHALERMAEQYFGVPPLCVEAGDPARGGESARGRPRSHRLRGGRGGVHGAPVIVVDLGTATRFDCVNQTGAFIGGAIAPGISVAVDALLNRAARLFRVELVRP